MKPPFPTQVTMLTGRRMQPGDMWHDIVARSLLDLALLSKAQVIVGTWGSTFSTLARDLAGPDVPLVNVKSWPVAAYCHRRSDDDADPSVPDSFQRADCLSIDDDERSAFLPSAEPRLKGERLAAACDDRVRNHTTCLRARASAFGALPTPFDLRCR